MQSDNPSTEQQNPPESTQNITAESVAKKRPGRPKKQMTSIPIEICGIVEKPAGDTAVMELVYCNPGMFKKILTLYKQFKASELELGFDQKGLLIFSKDHLNKSNIYTLIDGRCMNWYYCKMPIRICIKRDSLEKVLGTLSKNNYKITFLLKEENYRSTMFIVIKDAEYEIDNSYEIEISFKKYEDVEIEEKKDDDANYPIKMRMSSKYFKTQIASIRKLSKFLTIQKCGKDNLQLTCPQVQKVNWTGICSNEQKLDIKSTLGNDDLFNVSICIDYFHAFSNTTLGDEVFLAAHRSEKMSFMTRLDEKKDVGFSATVKVFTEIKDYRTVAAANPTV